MNTQPKPVTPVDNSDLTSQLSWAVNTLTEVSRILELPYVTLEHLPEHARKVMAELKSYRSARNAKSAK